MKIKNKNILNSVCKFGAAFITAASICVFSGCKTTNLEEPEKSLGHTDNVFAASPYWYVDPNWSNNAFALGGEAIAEHSTAIWLDNIAEIEAIEEGEIPRIPGLEDGKKPTELSLREHLQEAENQGNALVQLVLYGLPGRDCNSTIRRGELPASAYGMEVYQTHYIDRIASILEGYKHLPIVITIEPYSLAFSIINNQDLACIEVSNEETWGYTNAVRYAINSLSKFDNVHLYLDIAGANRLGRNTDLAVASLYYHGVIEGFDDSLYSRAQNLSEAIEDSGADTGKYIDIQRIFIEPTPPQRGDTSPPGYLKIDGFISNVADYVPLEEPYLGEPLQSEKGSDFLVSAYFYDWNPSFDEHTFTEDWLRRIRQLNTRDTGHLGMVIDTSRNGWGQAPIRGQDVTPTQDPERVNEYRIDQREHRRNWCNQPGGIGKRPQAAPKDTPWLDAYVWVKQPGISDGVSDPHFEPGPNTFNRGADPMCDPTKLSTYGQSSEVTKDLNLTTGAMDDAPFIGLWHETGFATLLQNAWPPLCHGYNDQCE